MRKLASFGVGLFSLFLLASPLHAQEGRITGQVTDSQGQPLESVTLQVVGTGIGTLSGQDGNFDLRGVPAGEVQVRASRIGYRQSTRTVEVTAGQTSSVDFSLQTSAVELSEVVATVGAGEVTRREIGTDVGTINAAEQVEEAAVDNLSKFLNARAGGVNVNMGSGNVGAGQQIRIRGINSLTQGNNPLLIIDGVRANNRSSEGINRGQTFSRFNDINPQTIESIQVVKGPSATTLYGSEAASGVIIIETKTGRSGGAQINLQVETGWSRDNTSYPPTLADVTPLVSGPDDPSLDGFTLYSGPESGQVLLRDNPFMDPTTSPFRTGTRQQVNLNIRGGAEGVTYFGSAAWESSKGVLPSNDLNNVNARANFAATPTDELDVRLSSGYTHSTTNLPKSGNNTSGYFLNAVVGFPTQSLDHNTGERCFGSLAAGEPGSFCDSNGNIRAAFEKIEPIVSREDLERFTTSMRVNYRPFSWMENTAKVGIDVSGQEFKDAIPFDPDVPFGFAAGGENFLTYNENVTRTADLSSRLSFDPTENVTSRTTVGAQYFMDELNQIRCQGRVFPNDQATACDAAVSIRGFSNRREKVEIGAYLQQRFGWNDYLYVTGAMRVDDNSSLGDLEDEIWSPSANFSWVVSDMPGWNVDWISQLRVRGAWGKASQSPEQYAADRTFVITRLQQSGSVVAGLTPQDPGNPELGAERSEEIEAGFNADLFEGRLGLSFTWFDQTTNGAILQVPVAPSSGFSNERWANVGELSSSGYEATFDVRALDRENFTWDLRFNAFSSDPVIEEVGIQNPPANLRKGFAPEEYLSRVITSAERNEQGEIVNVEYAPGQLNDGTGRRGIGSSAVPNQQSISSSINIYDRFRIHTMMDRKAGHKIYDGMSDFRCPLVDTPGLASSSCWRYEHRRTALTPVEQAYMERDFREGLHNGIWYQDADFIRFRELRVSYRMPEAILSQFGASSGRLYATGRNLAMWTDWPGLDPETRTEGARDQVEAAETGAALPPTQSFTLGINLSF